MKFTPLIWLGTPRIFLRIVLTILAICLFTLGVYKMGHWFGYTDGAASESSKFSRNMHHAAELEHEIVENLALSDLSIAPIAPGNYDLEIHTSLGYRIEIDTQPVTISEVNGSYSMIHVASRSPVPTEISTDGRFLTWESSDYRFEHFIGRTIKGIVVGRVFHDGNYGYLKTAGVAHFFLKPRVGGSSSLSPPATSHAPSVNPPPLTDR